MYGANDLKMVKQFLDELDLEDLTQIKVSPETASVKVETEISHRGESKD